MERKTDKIPPSASSLYVKLYCKKKGSSATKYRNILIEATKSWVSLTDPEKQQFYDKLNHCKTQYRKQFAEYLKHAKPYLKKKQCKRTSSNQSKEHQDISNLNIDESQAQQNITIETDATIILNRSGTKTAIELFNNNWEEQIEESQNEKQDNKPQNDRNLDDNFPQNEDSMAHAHELSGSEQLPEPTPPNVKTAEELFKIVQAMEGQHDRTWKSLTKPEKARYQKALLKLKKTYIVKYKEYLENLSPQALFDHYNKQIVD
ncbi:uncharacterized protein LOC126377849 [Pectinophora gossypiella]|uniref:uncharacterized protein LOC126377849 n=1 Tax=Pectinophora gossypiella TaxID=13191 RepID=UPI00214E9FAC|nr:uncharacterized protein LOC126377849 [Pectinophora gossypiella]